jgi:hypothetical protein
MAGYSGTPLPKKLGIKEGFQILAISAPENYRDLLEPLPASVRFVSKANQNTSLVHIFSTKKAQLSKALAVCRENSSRLPWSGSRGQKSQPKCRPKSLKTSYAK